MQEAARETDEPVRQHELLDNVESVLNSALETLRCTVLSELRALAPQAPTADPSASSEASSELVPPRRRELLPRMDVGDEDVSSGPMATGPIGSSTAQPRVTSPPADYYSQGTASDILSSSSHRPTSSMHPGIGRAMSRSRTTMSSAMKMAQTSSMKKKLAVWQTAYETFIAALIVMNAAWLGVEIQLSSSGSVVRWVIVAISAVFCALFTLDLGWRVGKQGKQFFVGKDFGWNWFDLVVVSVMIVELIFRSQGFARQFTVLRIVRLTRVVRIVRVLRELDKYEEFTVLLLSIRQCMPAVGGVIFMSMFFLYAFALSLHEAATGHCEEDIDGTEVCKYFGTLRSSCVSMYLAMFDGILWGELLDATKSMGWGRGALLILQVSFMKVVVTNAILGVVVSVSTRVSHNLTNTAAAIDSKTHDDEELADLFLSMDVNQSGAISLDEIEMAAEDSRIEAKFAQLKINVADVRQLFDMLDESRVGAVDIEEFVSGMQALRGDARALDVAIVKRQCSMILQHLQDEGRMHLKVEEGVASEPRTRASTFTPLTSPKAGTQFQPHLGTPCFYRGAGSVGCIESVEMRAMTLFELHDIRALISDLCVREKWTDIYTGARLTPTQVNLYHFAHHYILPATAGSGIILGIPGCASTPGAEVFQFDAEDRCTAEGKVVLATEAGPKVELQRGAFFLGRPRLRVGEIDVEQPTSIEAPESCSYKELVSSEPCRPVWFCSHWWGEAVFEFIDCCEEHARLRGLDRSSATYWTCAYANRQHSLESDIGGALEQTSFHKAMTVSQGVLLHLDPDAIAFTRIWCDFEIYSAVSDEEKGLDIITLCHGAPQLLCNTQLPSESARARNLREAKFPISLLVKGMYARLQDGEATSAADKIAILEYISEHGPCGQDGEENLRRVNSALNAIFARSAWPQAVKRGMVLDFDRRRPGALQLPDVLCRDAEARSLHMSLEHNDAVTDAEVANIAAALTPNLVDLKLSFEGCQHVSSAGLAAVSLRLPPQLQILKLDFLGCNRVDDVGLRTLADNLPDQLQQMGLHFDRCRNISEAGVRYLARKMPRSVKVFRGTFKGTGVDRRFDSLREIQALGQRPAFQPLTSLSSSIDEASKAISSSFASRSSGGAEHRLDPTTGASSRTLASLR